MPEDISGLAEALRSGALTAQSLLERCLERIETLDGNLNSFVALDRAGAEQAARESDRRLACGEARSALEGIPLSIKDNLLMKGLPASWGSRALKDFVPEHDELPVARLRAAGAVLIGKTNVPELTLEGYTGNDLFGITRNPIDPRLTPGGSSGGAAAGVAAGLVPAAIGTDGGGSIRRPACHTGLVGWKPSTGRIARGSGFPAILLDFEVIGTVTRTVTDAILLDGVLKGAHPMDRRSLLREAPSLDIERPRILYIPQFNDSPVDPEVAAAIDGFACELAQQGAEIIKDGLVFDLDLVNRVWRVISRSGVAYLMRTYPDLVSLGGASVQAMAEDGHRISGADYIAALEDVAALRAALTSLFRDYDFILTPSAAALPWPADQAYPDVIDGKPAGPRDHAVFTGWVNIAGLPAISLPVATSREGLPIGAQLVGGFGRDDTLLNFAHSRREV
ncbi:amidase [Rhizobium paknamense]|uniref:Indoleacetamide hydrolase n=1 Tax=Rhizobium paknamense TaxID=1206817 RepID=A0ABU0IBK4_9HYPH|nr:amidase [Rhizobium paknamense]MDQ0455610.1 aspartyl-tRNA(Asn)/glutamyl-tRNA(Gln) amidotransferase subunit A [Rhizobium paknamense]